MLFNVRWHDTNVRSRRGEVQTNRRQGTGRLRSIGGMLPVAGALLLLAGCSINQMAVRAVTGALSSGNNTVFTGDNDPQLIAQALPFALKMYEVLITQDPKNEKLLLTTGSLFIMYANAFVQTPADMLPDTEYQKQTEMRSNAKKLYLRGRNYAIRALELRHPDFSASLKGKELDAVLAKMTKADVPYLYWAAAGWAAAYAINPFDFALSVTINEPIAMMHRALALDPTFQQGAIQEFFVSYYAAAPESLGGSQEKAKESYQKALELSKGKRASVFVAYAQSIAVPEHNRKGFVDALKKALAIDPNADPNTRLETIVTQQKAKWLLDHVDNYFLAP